MKMPFLQLEHPWLLLLLIPYFLLLYLAWRKREPALTIPSVTPIKIMGNVRHRNIDWRKAIPFSFFALAGIFLIVGLSRPRRGMELVRTNTDGIDIILAVDLSGSMTAYDKPSGMGQERFARQIAAGMVKNRLEVSKEEITRFVDARPGDRMGLIVFAAHPYVICPPTLDHDFLLANLKRLNPGDLGDGTGIAGPLASGITRMKDSKAKSRIIVLFTDGVNNIDDKISPEDAARLAKTFNITIYTVGIGSGNALVQGNGFFANRLLQCHDQFDAQLLRNLAELTGGRYYHAADAKGMRQAMDDIDKLEKTSEEQPIMIMWKEYYRIFAWLALAALLAGMICRSTVCLKTP